MATCTRCLLFDERVPGAPATVLAAGEEMMRACVDAGGALSGEHGIGFEKRGFMPWLYTEDDLENMSRIRGGVRQHGRLQPLQAAAHGHGLRRRWATRPPPSVPPGLMPMSETWPGRCR